MEHAPLSLPCSNEAIRKNNINVCVFIGYQNICLWSKLQGLSQQEEFYYAISTRFRSEKIIWNSRKKMHLPIIPSNIITNITTQRHHSNLRKHQIRRKEKTYHI